MKSNINYDNIFIDPTSDIFVLYLFGSPENNDILLDFINSVLSDAGFNKIVEVEPLNPFNIRKFVNDKMSILDIKAKDEYGKIYDVEVQTIGDELYINRTLYYWAKNYSEQITKGDSYDTLKPVICINLLKFKLFDNIDKLHTCFMLYEKDYKDIPLTDNLIIHFLELEKFKKDIKIKKDLYNWFEYFKIEGKEKEESMETLLENNKIMKKAHEKYIEFTQNDELRHIYEQREKFQRDQISLLNSAKKEGIKEGTADVAKKMLEDGFTIEQVMKYTGLSREEILKLTADKR